MSESKSKSKSKAAKKAAPAKGKSSGDSPFVGREVAYVLAVGDGRRHAAMCNGQDGKFLRVRHPAWACDTYINLDHVASIQVLDDGAKDYSDTAPADPHAPAVDSAQVADALAAFKARPGPLPDTGG